MHLHITFRIIWIYLLLLLFNEFNVFDSLLEKGCHIRIIVRLGFPTSPFALEKLLSHLKILEAMFYLPTIIPSQTAFFGDELIISWFLKRNNLTPEKSTRIIS
jgi:hypothetical protein